MSGISFGTPNNIRFAAYSYSYNPSVTEPVCRPYGFGRHADMTEMALRSITNSGIWIPMFAPTCSSMISSDEPRCRGFNQTRTLFPLSIDMLLARDPIVGIPIPRSVSLRASNFTRTIMHDPVTKHLVTLSSL